MCAPVFSMLRYIMFFVGRGLEIDRSPVQGVLSRCLKEWMFSEVNSKSEQAGGPNS
jgi:hypothetical protein